MVWSGFSPSWWTREQKLHALVDKHVEWSRDLSVEVCDGLVLVHAHMHNHIATQIAKGRSNVDEADTAIKPGAERSEQIKQIDCDEGEAAGLSAEHMSLQLEQSEARDSRARLLDRVDHLSTRLAMIDSTHHSQLQSLAALFDGLPTSGLSVDMAAHFAPLILCQCAELQLLLLQSLQSLASHYSHKLLQSLHSRVRRMIHDLSQAIRECCQLLEPAQVQQLHGVPSLLRIGAWHEVWYHLLEKGLTADVNLPASSDELSALQLATAYPSEFDQRVLLLFVGKGLDASDATLRHPSRLSSIQQARIAVTPEATARCRPFERIPFHRLSSCMLGQAAETPLELLISSEDAERQRVYFCVNLVQAWTQHSQKVRAIVRACTPLVSPALLVLISECLDFELEPVVAAPPQDSTAHSHSQQHVKEGQGQRKKDLSEIKVNVAEEEQARQAREAQQAIQRQHSTEESAGQQQHTEHSDSEIKMMEEGESTSSAAILSDSQLAQLALTGSNSSASRSASTSRGHKSAAQIRFEAEAAALAAQHRGCSESFAAHSPSEEMSSAEASSSADEAAVDLDSSPTCDSNLCLGSSPLPPLSLSAPPELHQWNTAANLAGQADSECNRSPAVSSGAAADPALFDADAAAAWEEEVERAAQFEQSEFQQHHWPLLSSPDVIDLTGDADAEDPFAAPQEAKTEAAADTQAQWRKKHN